MKRGLTIGLVFTLLLALLGPGARAAAPGASHDLRNWKLTLPIDDAGGTTGEAAEIKNPQLQTYSSAFFYTGTDGAMVFWCPVIGATTSSATAPRTELREQMVAGSSSINWSVAGTHILRGQCRVTQLPDTGAVIIGQVHGYPAQRLIKLQQDAGRVQVYIRTSLANGGDTKFTWNIPTNTLLNYEIKVVDGEAFVSVNGVTNKHNFLADDPAWATITYYFKAGAYLQDNAGPVTEGGRVSFYQVSVTHGTNPPPVPPVITTQPTSQSVAAGANVTLSVAANSTAPLAFQWRTNGVNWPGRTNASITITNFRAADQRAYDVRITNAAGAATSSVARLHLNSPVRFLPSRRAGGVFTTTFVGVGGSNYVFETSTDLLRWTPVLTNRPANGLVEFSHTNTVSPLRFYRVR
jgi:hypothetical protein